MIDILTGANRATTPYLLSKFRPGLHFAVLINYRQEDLLLIIQGAIVRKRVLHISQDHQVIHPTHLPS